MYDDVFKTIKAQLYDRATSPLLGSFILSWIAWNYRFIMLIVSSMPATEKITYIDNYIFPSYEAMLLRGTLYPLITTLLLIFVYPIPARYVFSHWKEQQRKLKQIQQHIDEETPLTKQDARQIRQDILKATLDFEKEIEKKSLEISKLKELITELENQKSIDDLGLQNVIERSQLKILNKIADAPKGITIDDIIEFTKGDRIRTEFDIGELERTNCISREFSNELNKIVFKVTHRGLAYIVKFIKKEPKFIQDQEDAQP